MLIPPEFAPNFKPSNVTERSTTRRNIPILMQDGIRLATDLYFPAEPGRYPVLVERTPYGKHQSVMVSIGAPEFLAANGYVVAVQDARGRFASEGLWYPFRDEAWGTHKDGFDTVEWLARQEWCDGQVGTFGGSFAGFNQYLHAGAPSPHLRAMFARQAACSLRDEWIYRGGAFELGFMLLWTARNSLEALRNRSSQIERFTRQRQLDFLGHRPLAKNPLFSDPFDWIKDSLERQDDEGYWRQFDVAQFHESFTVPTYHLASWFDIFLGGSLRNFIGMRNAAGSEEARRRHRLTIGPWMHGPRTDSELDGQWAGEVDFGPEARWDYKGEMLRWFDYTLKHKAGGFENEPAVRYFVMGLNRWRTADDWPPHSVVYKELYFDGRRSNSAASLNDGSLSWTPGELSAPAARFVHDPNQPVESAGGNTLYSLTAQQPGDALGFKELNAEAGSRDQRKIEGRCLTFTTEPLDADLEITGPVLAHLFISSTAVDTDFVVRLTDVFPDGRSMLVCDGIQRARYRESNYRPSRLEPGRVYELTVDLWATSYLFRRGHRLRAVVNGSSFPRFDVNPGTGESGATATSTVIAENTIYLDRERRSHLVLPLSAPFARLE
jgi:putative CocE/NonD family hydrolase